MSKFFYVPIIKTSDAGVRALEKLPDDIKNKITPLFELTKSRKTDKLPEGDIFRRLKKIKAIFNDRPFILDLTGDLNSRNYQIEDLQKSVNGYKNWVDFLIEIQEIFPSVMPTIQIFDEDVNTAEEYFERLKAQASSLNQYFDNIVYRFPLDYSDFKEDYEAICKVVPKEKLVCIVDVEFVPQNKHSIYSKTILDAIKTLNTVAPCKVILSTTSFPKNPTEFGGKEEGSYNLEEWLLYLKVEEECDSTNVIYSDYATINPLRVPQAGGNGWVPRIDFPAEDTIFYYRSRRSKIESSYAAAYERVAVQVVNTPRYKDTAKLIKDCWGIKQIQMAAEGYPQGLSPSFWISVRMNIHMELRAVLL